LKPRYPKVLKNLSLKASDFCGKSWVETQASFAAKETDALASGIMVKYSI
jgi:hypothetical protein